MFGRAVAAGAKLKEERKDRMHQGFDKGLERVARF